MTREERAKQFLPFDALKGLQEELRHQEWLANRVPRRQLSDEAAALLSRRLSRVKRGDRIRCRRQKRNRPHADPRPYRHRLRGYYPAEIFVTKDAGKAFFQGLSPRFLCEKSVYAWPETLSERT